jgi:hypothetical protein
LSGWVALALGRRAPLVVTFHGTDLAHPVVGPLSRTLIPLVDVAAPVSATLARDGIPGAGVTRRTPVLPCGVNLERFRAGDRRVARERLGLEAEALPGGHLNALSEPDALTGALLRR